MKDTIETSRLILRKPRLEDVEVVHAAKVASLADVAVWLAWARDKEQLKIDTTRDRLAHLQNVWEGYTEEAGQEEFVYYIYTKDTDQFTGTIGFQFFDYEGQKIAELGYWAATALAGNGYMSEAAKGLSGALLAETSAEKITIACKEDNTGSRRVAEKAGFDLVKTGYNLSLRTVDPESYDCWFEYTG